MFWSSLSDALWNVYFGKISLALLIFFEKSGLVLSPKIWLNSKNNIPFNNKDHLGYVRIIFTLYEGTSDIIIPEKNVFFRIWYI